MDKTIVIEIFSTGASPQKYRIFETGEVHIGRSYHNDCVLMDPFVSAEHCVLRKKENGWVLTDLNSENGIYSRKHKIVISEVFIESGDEVIIGRTHLRFVSPEQAVAPARPLAVKNKVHKRLGRAVNAWSLILLTILFYAFGTHLESYENLSVKKLMAFSCWQVVCVLIWASVWAFVGRLIKSRPQFWAQISVTCLFWLVVLPAEYMVNVAGYLSTLFWVHWTVFAIVVSMLFTALLTRNLSFATNLSRRKQVKISLTISLVVMVVSTVSYIAFQDEFNPNPSYYAKLQTPFFKIRKSKTIDVFIQDGEEIFKKSSQKAQQAF
ncbi:hypothetical protein MNBD_UNCLBAC01-74 [hydrothermal vent metagenome]|uniref:FHA domain-containing protein n=1 Tax=hydrothermal vent metagenome TaxID=652676 RepID=A0A3B1DWI7_9ZZZZ